MYFLSTAMLDLAKYQQCISEIPFGKRLPSALYIFRVPGLKFGNELDSLLENLCKAYQISEDFNVIKFRTDELKLSFLSYPAFFQEPHPSLRHAITVDLVKGRARHTDYANNVNPPILHRKESFLPADHPMR